MIVIANRIFRRCTGYPVFCSLLLGFCLTLYTPRAWASAPDIGELSIFDVERVLRADGSPGPYQLTDRRMHDWSEKVWLNGKIQEREKDYLLDYQEGNLLFHREIPRGSEILVRFRQSPQVLHESYRLHKRSVGGEEQAGEYIPVRKTKAEDGKHILGRKARRSQLEIGGAKSIRVDFGDSGNGALSQSLRVNISGEVTKGVHMVALLSDRNLPLQSTGATRTLQELDQVLFKVSSRSVSAELGDIEVVLDETSFGRYRRRLQGASLALNGRGRDMRIFGAVSRGSWVTHRVSPIEGYQGPYRLSGGQGDYGGQVVAGSERVYINGKRLRRGEGQDYIVDYERGVLTFTIAQAISTDSRISVEYQYHDGANSSRLLGARGKIDMADDRLQVGATFIRESDRTSDIQIPNGASPGQARHQVAVLDAAFAPADGVSIKGEIGLSSQSESQSIASSSKGTRGQAFRFDVDLWPETFSLKGRNLGRFRLMGSYRQVGAEYSAFGRVDLVEREGRWGWQSPLETGKERAGEMTLEYAPRPGARLNLSYGRRKGNLFSSRKELGLQVSDPRLPRLTYRLEEISQTGGNLIRNQGRISGKIWLLRPGFQFRTESARGKAVGSSMLFYASHPLVSRLPNGIQSQEATWDLGIRTQRTVTWKSAFTIRNTRLLEGAWQDSVRGWTLRHEAGVSSWHGLSFSGDYSRSKIRVPRQNLKDRSTDLARLRMGFNRGLLSHQMSYRISSTGAPNRAPTFIYAGFGRGTHVWEDVDGDGLQDPEEFVQESEGDYELYYGPETGFIPVSEAALMVRTDLVFKRILRSSAGGWRKIASGVTADVSFQADRRIDPDSKGVAPWDLGSFRSGKEVINGRHDLKGRLYLNRYSRSLSFRLTGLRRSRLDRTFSSQGVEEQSEVAVMAKGFAGRRLDLEVEFTGGRRKRDGEPVYAYGVRSNRLGFRGFWRSRKGWQAGLRFEAGRDRESQRGLDATYFAVRPEVIKALPGKGRIRTSAEWARVTSNHAVPLFLGLAGGRRVGDNLSWRTIADYRLARNLTAMISYDGRKRPDRQVLHMGRMEMRAVF
jgi:hypothetical protein